jgi:peptide/nickel transport system permease protein
MLPASGRIFRRIWSTPTGRIGLAAVLLILALALLAPLVAPYGPTRIDVPHRLEGPSWAHWMGTDQLGRDLFSRIIHGARIAVFVSLAVIGLALLIGLLLGIAAALAPRQGERVILVLFDVISSFPSIILALALVALFGAGLTNLVVLVAIVFVPHFGRVTRAQTLAIKNAPFLEAERVLGASLSRRVLVHILPNIVGPILVLASMDIPVVITIEAGLSFLGIGVQPPLASWGSLLRDGYNYLQQSAWPTVFSAGALTVATLGSTLFGEALRDAIDPKVRGDR